MSYLKLLTRNIPNDTSTWAAGNIDPISSDFVPASRVSANGRETIIKIKNEKLLPIELGTIISTADAKILVESEPYKVGISDEAERELLDYVTHGKVTRGETVTLDDYDVTRYRERLELLGGTQEQVDKRIQEVENNR